MAIEMGTIVDIVFDGESYEYKVEAREAVLHEVMLMHVAYQISDGEFIRLLRDLWATRYFQPASDASLRACLLRVLDRT
jgi:hypothetical protein